VDEAVAVAAAVDRPIAATVGSTVAGNAFWQARRSKEARVVQPRPTAARKKDRRFI
jgi:hypothetical protein